MNTAADTPNPLESLTPRIRGAAHSIARQYNTDPNDVEQEMILAILERYAAEPEFLDQTAAYVVNFGAWRARNALKREAVQDSRCLEDTPLSDDPDAPTILDFVATTNPWPQVDLRLCIEQAMAGLDETNQQIASGLAAGYTPREIGPAIGVSYRTVYNRKEQIGAALQA